ncbi:MAG: penicillin-binding protein 2 [Candidatus Eisenbacteria bacterium]|jgi:penicillin-binding protein 2|nr:penicillin-binding protein 2 [Candidatus Eisenbacteria bacterium]
MHPGVAGYDRDIRPAAARAVLLVVLVLLSARLFYLQILQGAHYLELADSNRVRLSIIKAPRGLMYDRSGRIVAQDRAASTIVLDPSYGADSTNVSMVAELLGMSVQEAWRKIGVAQRRRDDCTLDPDATFATVSRIEERRDILRGTARRLSLRRRYPAGAAVGNLVGYIAEVSEKELNPDSPYRMGDLIGRSGLERQYESVLRGERGFEFIQVDAAGRELGPVPERSAIAPIPGHDLRLSIDQNLQTLAWDLIGPDRQGAVVALDPRRGDVLALVSRPSFDPNVLGSGMGHAVWAQLNSDSLFPLLNRPIQCAYPPGSTFKIATAAAALAEGVIQPSDRKTCTGAFLFGGRPFGCWKKTGHGSVDLRKAIVESCDVYFYQVGLAIGLERLSRWAHVFGFGEPTGIDLVNERSGLFPTVDWFNTTYGRGRWSRGTVVNLAIGQGEVLATPLQIAQFVGAIGNDGVMFAPRIAMESRDPVTGRRTVLADPKGRRLPLSPQTIALLKDAMAGVTEDPHGTAGRSRIPGVVMGGKTGTAQNPHGEDHAWFVGYAPADHPIIVACAFVERGGHGSSEAAPVASGVIKAWLITCGVLPEEESGDA